MVPGMTGFLGQAAVLAVDQEGSTGTGCAPIQLLPMEENRVAMTLL